MCNMIRTGIGLGLGVWHLIATHYNVITVGVTCKVQLCNFYVIKIRPGTLVHGDNFVILDDIYFGAF